MRRGHFSYVSVDRVLCRAVVHKGREAAGRTEVSATHACHILLCILRNIDSSCHIHVSRTHQSRAYRCLRHTDQRPGRRSARAMSSTTTNPCTELHLDECLGVVRIGNGRQCATSRHTGSTVAHMRVTMAVDVSVREATLRVEMDTVCHVAGGVM
jgi:hypothetical protein